VSRIGGGPDRPKRDISPEPEAARDGGLEERRVDEGWEGERDRRGWGGKGKGAATKAADSSRLARTRHGETTSGPIAYEFLANAQAIVR